MRLRGQCRDLGVLRSVIEDPALRRRLGERARLAAGAHDLTAVGPRWDRPIAELGIKRTPSTGARGGGVG